MQSNFNPIVALCFFGACFACLPTSSAEAQSTPRKSRYRFVETVRKPSTMKPAVKASVERIDSYVASPAIEPERIERIEQPQFESNDTEQVYDLPMVDPNLGSNSVSKFRQTSAFQATSANELGRGVPSSRSSKTVGFLPVDEAEPVRLTPMRDQALEQTSFQDDGVRVAQVYQVPQSSMGSAMVGGGGRIFGDVHPAPVDRFPFRDQYTAFPSPLNYVAPNYSSRNSRPQGTIFGVHPDEACDEWAGFCTHKNLEFSSNCGGLKANPGHLGFKRLVGNDNCEVSAASRLGCKSRSCGTACGCRAKKGCGASNGCSTCAPVAPCINGCK